MKKLLIKLINIYQKMPISTHKYCRFIPTCSDYTKQAINEYGAIKGLFFGIKRVLKCHPFGKSGIDLIPAKEKRWKKYY